MSPRQAFSLVLAAIGAAMMLVLASAGPLGAQTLTNSFGGLSKSSNEPIDIESDLLTVHDAKKYATFSGNVKAVQGTTTLRAKELDVHYVGGGDKLAGRSGETVPVANQPGAAGAQGAGTSTQINKIEARGNVVITSEDDQTTTSDWALYDVPAQLVTVGGNVVLTQGQNVLKGDRLIIDLKTGESRFENTGNTAAGGRIRALFMPKQEGAASSAVEPAGAEPAGAEPAEAGPQTIMPPAAGDSAKPASAVSGSAAAPASDAPADNSLPWHAVPEYR